ncbi:MAG: hypothetical protein ACXWWI_06785 [Nitrospira sp.]
MIEPTRMELNHPYLLRKELEGLISDWHGKAFTDLDHKGRISQDIITV